MTPETPDVFPAREMVERGDYTLIVLGSQGRGYFGEMFVGSVAHHVTRQTIVPTLRVPLVR